MRGIAGGVCLVLLMACGGDDDTTADANVPAPDAAPPDAAGWFEVVGESDLDGRGMNSALAIVGDTAYVGARNDGAGHAGAGIKIVDISDPAAPAVIGEIGPPDEGLLGVSSRELRAVPQKSWLVVLNLPCSPDLHACGRDAAMFPMTGGLAETDNLKIYDVSTPAAPVLVGTYVFPLVLNTYPHEFFLWSDPQDPARVLLYLARPLGPPELQVIDISNPAMPAVIATWDAPFFADTLNFPRPQNYLHSLSVSDDGTRAYLANLGAGLLVLDTSQVAANMASPVIATITPTDRRVEYENTTTHSAVAVPGRPVVVMTDEIYPVPYGAGCPWGWVHLADISDPAAPALLGELRLPENHPGAPGGCTPTQDPAAPQPTYTAHNPTLTEHVALVTWHAGGLVAIDTTDPAAPELLARFLPTPRASVAVEDPALGDAPVAMWSYPVIKDGLVYVVDIRNGLYVLRYRGRHAAEIESRAFLEGNSNRHAVLP
jgi:hypothetical protein